MKLVVRYRMFLIFLGLSAGVAIFKPELQEPLMRNTVFNFSQMLAVLPPIFILLGLLDQWVPRNVVIKYMGRESGFKGILLSIILGASSAGPLYGAFPFAAVMLIKGVRLANIVIFLSSWATLKIPMFLFESTALGLRFAVFRWLLNLPVILFIAYTVEYFVSDDEHKTMIEKAQLQG